MNCVLNLSRRMNMGAEVEIISYLGELENIEGYWHPFKPVVEVPQTLTFHKSPG